MSYSNIAQRYLPSLKKKEVKKMAAVNAPFPVTRCTSLSDRRRFECESQDLVLELSAGCEANRTLKFTYVPIKNLLWGFEPYYQDEEDEPESEDEGIQVDDEESWPDEETESDNETVLGPDPLRCRIFNEYGETILEEEDDVLPLFKYPHVKYTCWNEAKTNIVEAQFTKRPDRGYVEIVLNVFVL